jgi:hypothetical protein
MKFPPSFATPLDLSGVDWEAVRPWVARRVTAILGGVEDDVLIEYLMEQLQGTEVRQTGSERERAYVLGWLPGEREGRGTPHSQKPLFFPVTSPSTRACFKST